MRFGTITPHLDPFDICDGAIDVFTMGWCWALAEALNAETGWPIVIVGLRREEKDLGYAKIEISDWEHAMVQHPDGGYVDIEGYHPPSHSRPDITPLAALEDWSVERLASLCDCEGEDGRIARGWARAFVPAVLELVEHDLEMLP